jgi:hypothetical protein
MSNPFTISTKGPRAENDKKEIREVESIALELREAAFWNYVCEISKSYSTS